MADDQKQPIRFVEDLPEQARSALMALTPATYTGNAASQAGAIHKG